VTRAARTLGRVLAFAALTAACLVAGAGIAWLLFFGWGPYDVPAGLGFLVLAAHPALRHARRASWARPRTQTP
jgi:hypothetical protein